MKLYTSSGTCATACHIVLEESGLPYLTETVNLDTHRWAGGDYHDVNPKGYVPTLELDQGDRLTEVAVIVQVIADAAPQSHLLPRHGTLERYRVQEWLSFTASEVHKVFAPLWNEQAPAWAVDGVKEELARKFHFISQHLKGRIFLMGSQYTVADAYLFTVLNWTPLFKIDMLRWPALMSYMERIETRPAVRHVLSIEGLNAAPSDLLMS